MNDSIGVQRAARLLGMLLAACLAAPAHRRTTASPPNSTSRSRWNSGAR